MSGGRVVGIVCAVVGFVCACLTPFFWFTASGVLWSFGSVVMMGSGVWVAGRLTEHERWTIR